MSWVFQFGTGLTTAVNSSVTLINPGSNGGADDGVFWNAATGAIVIGDNNTVLGNYIAYTSISFTGSNLFLGSGGVRFLALNAAVTFAGPGTLNPLGGSGGSDWTGGLKLNGSSVVATSAPVTTAGQVRHYSPTSASGIAGPPIVAVAVTATSSPTSYSEQAPAKSIDALTGVSAARPCTYTVTISAGKLIRAP